MKLRAEHFGAEEVDLRKVVFTPEILACVPAEIARRHRVVPIDASPRHVRVALADPSDLNAIDSVNSAVQRELELAVAEEAQIEEFIPRLYPEDAREC
jgi:type IV pilus assembly protein PilB